MDVYCPHCGEPWDLAEIMEERAWKRFQTLGCRAIPGAVCSPSTDEEMAQRAQTCYAVLGDDPDGCAALLEDMEDLA